VLLALFGGALGTVFALWGTAFLTRFLAQTHVPVAISPDGRVLRFTISVSLLTGVLFGLAPAWRLSRLDIVFTIKSQSQGASAGAGSRLQPSLVVTQVALAVLLLASAGLFARTLRKLQTVELGFARAAVPLQFCVPFFGSDLRMAPTFCVRTEHSAAASEADLRRALARVDSRLSLSAVRSMDETIDRLLVRERIIAQLTGFFGCRGGARQKWTRWWHSEPSEQPKDGGPTNRKSQI